MNPSAPDYSRREFLKSATGAAAAAVGANLVTATARAALPAVEPMIGIQVGAVSFLDEGTEPVLDLLQEKGAVNTLFLATYTHGRGIGGRQIPDHPFPDHGKREYDLNFHGGNFATPHPEFYRNTSIAPLKAPDHGPYDLLADVLPRARRRGMKVYAWYEDSFRDDTPGVAAAKEIDWQGRPGANLCPRNPDYVGFLTGLTEDYCRSYGVDGVMWGSERQGPLHNALAAHHGRAGDSARVTCFCRYCQKAAGERGIDVKRAREGFQQLDRFVRAAQRPVDGYFVSFWRLLIDYPELVAWEKLWTDGKHSIYAAIKAAANQSRPETQVGFHLWHANSFSPFFRAEQDYLKFARVSDYLKVVLYNNCGGPRYAGYIRNVGATLFADLPPDQVLELHNHWLGYGKEASLEKLPTAGLSADYVYRETLRARTDVQGKCRIYPGLDIDVPTAANEKQTEPGDVYASTLAGLRAGAEGVLFSRKYSEMRLANLEAGGRAVRAFAKNQT